MAFEVLTFRPCSGTPKCSSYPVQMAMMGKWLWLGALAFPTLSCRDQAPSVFTEPIPFRPDDEHLDGSFRPALRHQRFIHRCVISGFVLLGRSLSVLRRSHSPDDLHLSSGGYFPLFLISGSPSPGSHEILWKVDIVGVKNRLLGCHVQPKVPDGIGVLFYIHLFLSVSSGLYSSAN